MTIASQLGVLFMSADVEVSFKERRGGPSSRYTEVSCAAHTCHAATEGAWSPAEVYLHASLAM